MSDPIGKLIGTLLSSIKDDIAEAIGNALDGVVEQSTINSIVNGIYRGLRAIFISSYKSSVGDRSSDAYHMYGSGIGTDLMKFVGASFKNKLSSLVSDVLGGELNGYAKGISTDIYRLIINAIKSKSGGSCGCGGGSIDKRKQRGQLVSKLMKEKGLSLGDASREASIIMKKK